MKTPLQIGEKHYAHGLGTHAVSEIVVRLPQPGKLFEAEAGADNNYDTKGQHGTVNFAVEVAGKEAVHSDLRRGGQAPLPVRVELQGAKEFVLRVFDGGDGPSWDQSDWADAAVTLENGERLWLDEMTVVRGAKLLTPDILFSFTYDCKSSAQLLATWKRTSKKLADENCRQATRNQLHRSGNRAGGCLRGDGVHRIPAEWVVRLRNGGAADTPLLENIRPLDLRLNAPDGNITLRHSHGSTCRRRIFCRWMKLVAANAALNLAPNGGRGPMATCRSSTSNGPRRTHGAIGWSGQWAMNLRRDGATGLTLQAGQQVTRLKLHPGESIRTPRILLVQWEGGGGFADIICCGGC